MEEEAWSVERGAGSRELRRQSIRPYAVCRMPLAMRAAHREMQRQRRLTKPGPL